MASHSRLITRHRIGAAFALLWLFFLAVAPGGAQDDNTVLVLEIEGPVTPAMAGYFERGIEQASQEDASAVVIVLDTPGGSVDVTLDIVQTFRSAEVPVIVYVAPAGAQAASAGSVITAAAHAAGMAPDTVIGAAAPVDSSGADIDETLFLKITEDLKATMRNLTARRGEEAVALAEAMIEEARAVTATEALEVGFIDAVASDVDDLLQQVDGLTLTVNERTFTLDTGDAVQQPLPTNTIESLLHALANPLLIGLLLTLGVQAILIEISNPGGWVAGFIGVLALGSALYGLGTLPANYLGLGLLVVAFVLLVLEVKTPTTGALGVAGAVTLLAGLLVLFNSPGTPEFARISIFGAATISVVTAAFFLFLVGKVLQAQSRQAATGAEGMLGAKGSARAAFEAADPEAKRFRGTVLVHGEIWQAVSDKPIQDGEPVLIQGAEGFTLQVSRFE